MINSILRYPKGLVKSNSYRIFIALALFGAVIYYPALQSDFIADDIGQIVKSSPIRDLRNIFSFFGGGTFYIGDTGQMLVGMYYRPIMITLYAVLYFLFGAQPVYFHSFQLFIHVINAYLVFLLFRKSFKKAALAILLAFVFFVHPINVEAVSYIANLQDVLVFMFGAGALLVIMKSAASGKTYIVLFILLLLSLLSKETSVVYILLIYTYGEVFRSDIAERMKKPIAVVSVFALFIYIGLRCGVANICMLPSNAPIAGLSLPMRIAHIPAVLTYYITTFFFPKNMAILQQWVITDLTFRSFYLPLIITVVFLGAALAPPFVMYKYRSVLPNLVYRRWMSGTYSLGRQYVFFLLWFLMGLSMHIHIFPLDFTVADRWFYFPIVGLLGMIGSLIGLLNVEQIRRMAVVFSIVIFVLSLRSYVRNKDWGDHLRLYRRDSKLAQGSGPLENNYAVELLNRGQTAEAKAHFIKALELQPESPIYLSNMGIVAEKEGDLVRAEDYYRRAIMYGKWPVAFERYALVLKALGRKQELRDFLEDKALKLFPGSVIIQSEYAELDR